MVRVVLYPSSCKFLGQIKPFSSVIPSCLEIEAMLRFRI